MAGLVCGARAAPPSRAPMPYVLLPRAKWSWPMPWARPDYPDYTDTRGGRSQSCSAPAARSLRNAMAEPAEHPAMSPPALTVEVESALDDTRAPGRPISVGRRKRTMTSKRGCKSRRQAPCEQVVDEGAKEGCRQHRERDLVLQPHQSRRRRPNRQHPRRHAPRHRRARRLEHSVGAVARRQRQRLNRLRETTGKKRRGRFRGQRGCRRI